jgi:peptidoglycan/xylan/chitin deacetylase (PgdA/CDA1 family)
MYSTLWGKKLLMIHKFKEEYLKLPLDDYILTFDDGIYNHYLWYKKIIEKFPNIKMIFFISGGIININDNQKDMESPDAHELYFTENKLDGFMTIDQIKEISSNDNCYIGLHGYKHLNIVNMRKRYKLIELHQLYKLDCISMFKWKYDQHIENNILFNKINEVLYCTPYNQVDELALAILKKEHKESKLNFLRLTIVGPGRVDIETLNKD